MKHIRIFAVLLAMSLLSFTGCESYFDVDLDDQANIQEIFGQSTEVRKYLSYLYSYIPRDENLVNDHGGFTARSDEAQFCWYNWVNYLNLRSGNYSSASYIYNYWSDFYKGIQQCSIFMDSLQYDNDDPAEIVELMRAEARFLRAFYYFCLFRQYGPVFIWGDQQADKGIVANTVDRHTVDQNVEFIVSELDKAAEVLPNNYEETSEGGDRWMGRATKGAALALKSRITLYAASPLYNGCDLYKRKMQNYYGDYLFPQEYDASKWEVAEKAAQDMITYAETGGRFRLLTGNPDIEDDFERYMNAYESINFEPWNEETIWGWWRRSPSGMEWLGPCGYALIGCMPAFLNEIYAGYNGVAASFKLIDSYPMYESGRYPVTGYLGQNDYSQPVIDAQSGYVNTGFKDDFKQPEMTDKAAIKVHMSTVGRDPRFYASLVPNGFYFPNKNLNNKKGMRVMMHNSNEKTTLYNAGENCLHLGYVWRRLYKPHTSLATANDYASLRYVYPAFRLAEIYLNHAEAACECGHMDAAIRSLNKVRNRVGLKNIEEAYPNIAGDKAQLRWCIRKERMCEFGLENKHHYDACRWMTAKQEYPGENWCLSLSSTTYEGSYVRSCTEMTISKPVFADKDYLYPIHADKLAEMTNMTQNLGH